MNQDIQLILDALAVNESPNVPASWHEDRIQHERQELISLLQVKMADNPDASNMIKRYLEQPDVWGGVLSDALVDTDAAQDPDVVDAARRTLAESQSMEPDEARETEPISGDDIDAAALGRT